MTHQGPPAGERRAAETCRQCDLATRLASCLLSPRQLFPSFPVVRKHAFTKFPVLVKLVINKGPDKGFELKFVVSARSGDRWPCCSGTVRMDVRLDLGSRRGTHRKRKAAS